MVETRFVSLNSEWKLHVIQGGNNDSDEITLLIHGGDRKYQTAEYWEPHFSWLEAKGRFYAVTLLGHGSSVPGVNDELPEKIDVLTQAQAITTLLKEDGHLEKKQHVNIIARSYGGNIAIRLANAHPILIKRLIFIAPAISMGQVRSLPLTVRRIPTLFLWARDDRIVPMSKGRGIQPYFEKSKLIDLGKILTPGKESWRAHTPENENPGFFHEIVDLFFKETA